MGSQPVNRFDLVVFDVAGTTILDGDAVLQGLIQALDPYVHVTLDDARGVMGLPKPVAIRDLLSAFGTWTDGALDALVDEVHRSFKRAIIERYRDDDAVVAAPGAERLFELLRRSGVRVALDTGFSRDILDPLLRRVGWGQNGSIDVSVTSDEVERGRPFPELIYRAMELAGVTSAARVVKVGDTLSDMREGLNAGCGLVVGVTHGTHTREQLTLPGTVVIDQFDELLPLMGLEAE